MNKNKSVIPELLDYAGNHKYFTISSWILAAISALVALVPFYYIWCIIKEVVEVRPDYSKATHIVSYGWSAVGMSLLAMFLYISALMCSHLAAFRVQTNMRKAMMEHVMKLPMGYIESEGSGKIRKIVAESSAATETFLAHSLPDKAVSYATPVGLIAMLLIFDWRIGLICLVPAVLAFLMMGGMMGEKMQNDMKEYQNALDEMSAEAVEYVRGIPVVKTFGQSVFSFKRFKDAIDKYEKWTITYTIGMRMPMIGFTTAANAVFAALVACSFIFTGNGVSNAFLYNILFYIIITPILTVTLMKVAYAGEAQRISIARAFLKNAPILILDEATAFADPDNEIMVQKAFANLSKDKTVIMIAHRLSTVVDADKICVLSDGKIVESGKHDALLAKGGIYDHMWNEYKKSVNWKMGREQNNDRKVTA